MSERTSPLSARWMKRVRMGWRFKCLPWNVPASIVEYVSLKRPSEADLRRGEELAKEHGWR